MLSCGFPVHNKGVASENGSLAYSIRQIGVAHAGFESHHKKYPSISRNPTTKLNTPPAKKCPSKTIITPMAKSAKPVPYPNRNVPARRAVAIASSIRVSLLAIILSSSSKLSSVFAVKSFSDIASSFPLLVLRNDMLVAVFCCDMYTTTANHCQGAAASPICDK